MNNNNNNNNQAQSVNPKKVVHYYVDGGKKDGGIAVAFLRKGYFIGSHKETRKYYKSNWTSTKAELRAIALAYEDAIKLARQGALKLENVIIHTDQKWLLNNDRLTGEAKELVEKLFAKGIKLYYYRSIHQLPDGATKKEQNAFETHTAVLETLAKKPNRFILHKRRKAREKRAEKKGGR